MNAQWLPHHLLSSEETFFSMFGDSVLHFAYFITENIQNRNKYHTFIPILHAQKRGVFSLIYMPSI